MGRWCWTQYRGKHGIVVRIISAYRCVENISGPQSVWSQQTLHLERTENTSNPRDVFVTDLFSLLQTWTDAGEVIILGLDLNEDIEKADFTKRLVELGLVEINLTRHGRPPPSFIRGSTPIDGLYVSAGLSVCACGSLPFLGDHRPSWIDVPLKLLFGQNDKPPLKARRLKLQDPRIVTRYNDFLVSYIAQHDLVRRAQILNNRLDFQCPSYVEEYDSIDKLRSTGMQQAEKQCRKLRMGEIPYTPAYNKAAQTVIAWRLIVKMKEGRSVDSRYFNRQIQVVGFDKPFIMSMSLKDALLYRRQSYKALNDLSKMASTSRVTWMESLAAARAAVTGIDTDQELRNLMHREQQRKSARIIKRTFKPRSSFGLSMIQVHSEGGIQELTEKHDMELTLCTELAKRFNQASSTPFATDPLVQLIGPLGTSLSAQQILDGTFTCPSNIDIWVQKLIPHLKYIPDAQKVHSEFMLTLSPADHQMGWSKMKERTSPGYSQLSFAQFKAASMEPETCLLDSLMAEIPFATGISPTRWKKGLDIMLQKQEGNFLVDKLRAILLYESDFNQNNKRFGKQFMDMAEKYQGLAIEQFGSRKHMSAIDQSLNKAFTFDIWRQFCSPGALCSNDAKSCYDRIVHNFASICLQRIGVPTPPIISMFSTIQELHHHIRTVHGDSTISFSGNDGATKIQGVGQGNGSGPQIWAAVSSPLLNLVRSEGCGTFLKSAISSNEVQFVGYAFVDDTDLVSSNHHNTSGTQVVQDIQRSLSTWQGGINASGGAIVPEKSHWYYIDFKWQNGLPVYKKKAACPGTLKVKDSGGNIQTLRLLEPWEAERTLGVRLAPDGNMKAQTSHMRHQAAAWSDQIRSGYLSRPLVLQALFTTILKTLEYPLPATVLTQQQCDYIMVPILRHCLPRVGVVRTFPRRLVYASVTFHGLNIPNLYWLQGFHHIDRILRFGSSTHLTGQLLRHSLEAFRLEVGFNGSLFRLPFNLLESLVTSSWCKHTWEFLYNSDIQVDVLVPELSMSRVNDVLLMPFFLSNGFTGNELAQLNRCRLFLQVSTLSDICNGFGTKILSSSWKGQKEPTRKSMYTWPNQSALPMSYWQVWKKALSSFCSSSLTLRHPLGQWLSSSFTDYFYDPSSERIYVQTDNTVAYFRRINGRPSRNSVSRFADKQFCDLLPPDVSPATVEFHRSSLVLTGWAKVISASTPVYLDFFGYLAAQTPVSASWAFKAFQFIGDFSHFVNKISTSSVLRFIAVSDGSFKDGHGTASWCLSLVGSPGQFVGSTVVPGARYSQSAYRSELTGIYGICITLWLLQQYFDKPINVEIGCDGLSAIRSCQYQSDSINPNTAQFDLIYACRFLLREVRGSVCWRHVKGHQDDHATTLDSWARLNVQMDTAAKSFWEQTVGMLDSDRVSNIFGEPGSLYLNNEKIVLNLKSRLMDHLSKMSACPYWTKHFDWHNDISDSINWTRLGQAASLVPTSRRIWAVKTASTVVSLAPVK